MLFRVIDGIVERKYRGAAKRSPFSWYYDAFGFDSQPGPTAKHCFPPRKVLNDLESIELEVARHGKKYRGEWIFWLPGQASTEPPHMQFDFIGFYKQRRCRLFSDEQGCWACEIDPGPREGVHHELTEERSVDLQLTDGGEFVTIALERRPFAIEYPEMMVGLKKVCRRAVALNGLLLASDG